MTTQEYRSSDEDEPLKHWRQGDFALAVGGFLYAAPAEGEEAFDAEEHADGIVGLIAISQTCDIVRRSGGRDYVTVCPLIEVNTDELSATRKGRRPYLTEVENTGEAIFADLRRIMSIAKDLVRTWNRREGFSSESGRVRFAAALERKFGQFAFPDEFNQATKGFKERVWQRHDKRGSMPGNVYRSLAQIRFRADPDWSANKRTITVIAVMREECDRNTGRYDIGKELESALSRIEWPSGYQWNSPRFILATAKEITAEDVIASRRGDFDFLCY